MARRLTNLRIDEVSSVDRGAGEHVKIALMKRDDTEKREFSTDERQQAASRGQALPDGSFPIKNKGDLHNAIQAIGRAKNPAKAKAHIKTRARALGASDMIPDSWSKREADALKALHLAVNSIGNDPDKLVECFKQFHEFLGSEPPTRETDMTNDEITKLVSDAVAAAFVAEKKKQSAKPVTANTTGTGSADQNEDDGDSATDDNPAQTKKMDMSDTDASKLLANLGINVGKKEEPKDQEIAKRDAQIIDLTKAVTELRTTQAKADFAKRAVAIGLTEPEGEQLRKAYSGDVTALKFLEDTIGKLHTQVEKAGLFGEVGSSGGSPATPHDELMGKALELRKASSPEKPLTEAQAYVKAMELYPDIAKREAEQRASKMQKLA